SERHSYGPGLLRRALAKVPAEALKWKPAAGRWSAHEIVVHCADSETNAHMRLRYLLAEPDPLIVGYDQDRWALTFDYHAHPLDTALATVEAVRGNTRSEEHTSELQSRVDLVCRLLLEKKKDEKRGP